MAAMAAAATPRACWRMGTNGVGHCEKSRDEHIRRGMYLVYVAVLNILLAHGHARTWHKSQSSNTIAMAIVNPAV